MRYFFTAKFQENYHDFPSSIRGKFDRQLAHLLRNLSRPSLRAKKYDEARGIWQARVDKHYRFYFLVEGDCYILLSLGPHPK
ncbi:MAG: hypothetical protein AAB967_03200 [Patescibacteria group bacterium]